MVIRWNIIPWAIGSHGGIWCLVSEARKRLPRSQRSCFAHYQAISWSLCISRLESREYETKGTYEMRGEDCKVYEKPECNREESYTDKRETSNLYKSFICDLKLSYSQSSKRALPLTYNEKLLCQCKMITKVLSHLRLSEGSSLQCKRIQHRR